jgi:hypothetical protein
MRSTPSPIGAAVAGAGVAGRGVAGRGVAGAGVATATVGVAGAGVGSAVAAIVAGAVDGAAVWLGRVLAAGPPLQAVRTSATPTMAALLVETLMALLLTG